MQATDTLAIARRLQLQDNALAKNLREKLRNAEVSHARGADKAGPRPAGEIAGGLMQRLAERRAAEAAAGLSRGGGASQKDASVRDDENESKDAADPNARVSQTIEAEPARDVTLEDLLRRGIARHWLSASRSGAPAPRASGESGAAEARGGVISAPGLSEDNVLDVPPLMVPVIKMPRIPPVLEQLRDMVLERAGVKPEEETAAGNARAAEPDYVESLLDRLSTLRRELDAASGEAFGNGSFRMLVQAISLKIEMGGAARDAAEQGAASAAV